MVTLRCELLFHVVSDPFQHFKLERFLVLFSQSFRLLNQPRVMRTDHEIISLGEKNRQQGEIVLLDSTPPLVSYRLILRIGSFNEPNPAPTEDKRLESFLGPSQVGL